MLHSLEIESIRFLHQFRTPWLDHFFKGLDLFDRPEFFFLLIPIVWLGIGWKSGLKLFYVLLLSAVTNHGLKELFLSPRPFHLDPALGIIQVSGLGFPSGAAQTVILLSGLLWKSWQGRWKWVGIIGYIALVSFSRIYLGLHFPSDILGGWLVGFALFMIYHRMFPILEMLFMGMNPFFLFLLSQAVPGLLLFFSNATLILRIGSVAIGIGVGLFLSHAYQLFLEPPQGRKQFLLRGAIGVIGAFLCYGLILWIFPSPSKMHLFLQFSFLGLWLGLGSHVFCRLLLKQKASSHA